MDNDILLIFLGSFLTFSATMLVEYAKYTSLRKDKRQNFIILTRQLLENVSKSLDRLKTVLEFNNYFDYKVLDIIESRAKSLEEQQRDSIYLESAKAKEDFIDIVSDIVMYIAEARAIQQLYYNEKEKLDNPPSASIFTDSKSLNEYFERQKTQKVIDLVELKRRIQEYLQRVS